MTFKAVLFSITNSSSGFWGDDITENKREVAEVLVEAPSENEAEMMILGDVNLPIFDEVTLKKVEPKTGILMVLENAFFPSFEV